MDSSHVDVLSGRRSFKTSFANSKAMFAGFLKLIDTLTDFLMSFPFTTRSAPNWALKPALLRFALTSIIADTFFTLKIGLILFLKAARLGDSSQPPLSTLCRYDSASVRSLGT